MGNTQTNVKFEYKEKRSLEIRQKLAEKHLKENRCLIVFQTFHSRLKHKKQYQFIRSVSLDSKCLKIHDIWHNSGYRPQLSDQESIFLYCDNKIINNDEKVIDLYEKCKDKDDQILYVICVQVDGFG